MIPEQPPTTPEGILNRMDGVMRPLGNGRQLAFLPSPRVQNHAAFLLRGADNNLTCAWFAGGLEGKADICIHRSTLVGDHWSEAEQLTNDPERSEQNPVLFSAPDGRNLLIHTSQPGGNQDRCTIKMHDLNGDSRELPLPLGSFVRARPEIRSDGAWLLPLFHCTHSPGARWTGRHDTASVAISSDNGQSWRRVEVPDSVGCVHMTLVPLGNDHYAAFFRRRQADYVYRCESTDGGESWSSPQPTDVPNNNSSIGVRKLSDGRIAMVCNPTNADMDPSRRESLYDELYEDDRPEADGGCNAIWGVRRAPLILALSSDGGHSFDHRILLLDGPGTCLSNDSEDGRNKELSYPALDEAPNGDIDVCFTYHRRAIAHHRIPAAELKV